MKIERGSYKVVRACCQSGNCVRCFGAFNKAKRKPVVQMDNLSKRTAEQVALNWKSYGAKVVEQ
jgi:uncharacterized Fe-S cluster protein YjdI